MFLDGQFHVMRFGQEGLAENGTLQGADGITQLLDDDIVRGGQNGLVKGDVGFVKGVRILAVFFHGVETGLDGDQIDRSGPFGRPA